MAAVEKGGTQEEVLNLGAQTGESSHRARIAVRNLDALRQLQQQGAASAGEVREAEGFWLAPTPS